MSSLVSVFCVIWFPWTLFLSQFFDYQFSHWQDHPEVWSRWSVQLHLDPNLWELGPEIWSDLLWMFLIKSSKKSKKQKPIWLDFYRKYRVWSKCFWSAPSPRKERYRVVLVIHTRIRQWHLINAVDSTRYATTQSTALSLPKRVSHTPWK